MAKSPISALPCYLARKMACDQQIKVALNGCTCRADFGLGHGGGKHRRADQARNQTGVSAAPSPFRIGGHQAPDHPRQPCKRLCFTGRPAQMQFQPLGQSGRAKPVAGRSSQCHSLSLGPPQTCALSHCSKPLLKASCLLDRIGRQRRREQGRGPRKEPRILVAVHTSGLWCGHHFARADRKGQDIFPRGQRTDRMIAKGARRVERRVEIQHHPVAPHLPDQEA